MEYQDPQYPSHYPGQPHIPVKQKRRVTFRKHLKNQWGSNRDFIRQWWRQKTNKQQQQPASYYPPQTGSGVSRPYKRRRKHYQNGGLMGQNYMNGGISRAILSAGREAKRRQKPKKSFEGKQSGSGMGNLTRKTSRKSLNTVPTHFQYYQ